MDKWTTLASREWEKVYEKVYEFVKNNDVKLAFNPGALQIYKRDKYVMNIIEETDYLFLNKEEAEEILYGKKLEIQIKNNDSFIKKLLFGLKSLGAKNIIITDSDDGSYCYDEEDNLFHLGSIKTQAVEKTGAGDAYNAGFIASVLKSDEIKQAMVWGTLNASSVIQKIGAEEGLLNEMELTEKTDHIDNIPWKNFT